MNASDMLDYALGRLEGDDAERAAREVESDPATAERAERLARSLDLLLDDGEDAYVPPPGMARRTLDFVERAARERPAVLELAPAPRRFGLGDFAMAATIFLASLLALAPAVLRGKERWGRAACMNNLQKVGVRLHQYAALNHAYPFVDSEEEVPHAGAILCRLNEAGFPIDPRDLRCPSSESGATLDRVPRYAEVAERQKVSPQEACRLVDNDYAFHIGHYLPSSARAKAGPLRPDAAHQAIPIAGDRPGFDRSLGLIRDGNSPNHGGQGQNVLYADGHASWLGSRWVSPTDKDLYLNEADRPAYGLNPDDAVLMPAGFRVNSR
jgi:prepilin-type processing-associated H-X9-DG protein